MKSLSTILLLASCVFGADDALNKLPAVAVKISVTDEIKHIPTAPMEAKVTALLEKNKIPLDHKASATMELTDTVTYRDKQIVAPVWRNLHYVYASKKDLETTLNNLAEKKAQEFADAFHEANK